MHGKGIKSSNVIQNVTQDIMNDIINYMSFV